MMKRRWMLKVLSVILLTCFAMVALFPFAALLLASFKPANELMRFGLNL